MKESQQAAKKKLSISHPLPSFQGQRTQQAAPTFEQSPLKQKAVVGKATTLGIANKLAKRSAGDSTKEITKGVAPPIAQDSFRRKDSSRYNVSNFYSNPEHFVRKSTNHNIKTSSDEDEEAKEEPQQEQPKLKSQKTILKKMREAESKDFVDIQDFLTEKDSLPKINEEFFYAKKSEGLVESDFQEYDFQGEVIDKGKKEAEVGEGTFGEYARKVTEEAAARDDATSALVTEIDYHLTSYQGQHTDAGQKEDAKTEIDEEEKEDDKKYPPRSSSSNILLLEPSKYPSGYSSRDDLNHDGVIDRMEQQLKVISRKEEIREEVEDHVKADYRRALRKEVDFHHKVAYRFERTYRLSKQQPEKRNALNLEIIDVIRDQSDYVMEDPKSLFFCLYFCIYYNNPELIEFLRTLIIKMKLEQEEGIKMMLDNLEAYGVQRLRTVGESVNQLLYHYVFYVAFEDNLRVVYQQVLRQLRLFQLRDRDALKVIEQRDYELIQATFSRYPVKLLVPPFVTNTRKLRSNGYRQYNEAYYEEVLIVHLAESRIAQNYRERFLTSNRALNLVLEMYCKNDFVAHFLNINLEDISRTQKINLFQICLRHDSFKIGMLLYLKYLDSKDIDQKMMDIITISLRESTAFHELKLFFIHQHFELLSILQMNNLVDVLIDVLHTTDMKMNPMLSQYNTIKYALLVFRISFKIESRKIYSLITKCYLLNNYIKVSLIKYLEKQHHIAQLYKFIREPVFHMTERKDSMDLMLEMGMKELVNHPVIIEVINLIYEGQYSIDLSALDLSATFQCFFQMSTLDKRSINQKMLKNIQSFGLSEAQGKQSSLQFHIWKQCIEQRMQDEMLFTVMFGILATVFALLINEQCNQFVNLMDDTFQANFVFQNIILQKATPNQLLEFCEPATDLLITMQENFQMMYFLMYFTCFGYFTSIIQKLIIMGQKDNVDVSFERVLLEIIIVSTSIGTISFFYLRPHNTLLTDFCIGNIEISDSQKEVVDFAYALISQENTEIPFQLLMSANVIFYTFGSIVMLQRSSVIGELILMIGEMLSELKRFFLAFGLYLIAFVVVGRLAQRTLNVEDSSLGKIALNIFDAFVGNQNYSDYTYPNGKVFLTVFVYLSSMLLLTFMVAMFNNKYQLVFGNLEFLRRQTIIQLKNSVSYDAYLGGITTSYFPINIILLPFIGPILFLRNERLNDIILKSQYWLLMFCYLGIAGFTGIFLVPMLYMKCLINQVYLIFVTKRQDYKGQKFVELITTIFTSPFIIVTSLVVDFAGLPNFLLQDETTFQLKYRQSQDGFEKIPLEQVMRNFSTILYTNFEAKFQDMAMTLMTLMQLHTKAFDLIENLHDLFCRGTKDYVEALSNVQVYNMTKILTRKCSYPNETGDIKQNICDFNVIHAVQMDIEMFNYTEGLFKDYQSGKMKKDVSAVIDSHQRFEKVLVERKDFQFEPQLSTMQGTIQRRVNSDAMNNFFIDIVSHSFTNIDEVLKQKFDTEEAVLERTQLKKISEIEGYWKHDVTSVILKNFAQIDSFLQKRFGLKGGSPKKTDDRKKKYIAQHNGQTKTIEIEESSPKTPGKAVVSTITQPGGSGQLEKIDEMAEFVNNNLIQSGEANKLDDKAARRKKMKRNSKDKNTVLET